MRKRRWNAWSIFCCTGFLWFVIFAFSGIWAKKCYWEYFYHREWMPQSKADILNILFYSGLGWLAVVAKTLIWLDSDTKIGLFTWLRKYKYVPRDETSLRREAQYPPVPDELLSNTPGYMTLARVGKKYVKPAVGKGNILNALILGSAGCGKSVLLLTWLLSIHHLKPKKGGRIEPISSFWADIKPELARKSVKIRGNKRVKVMNPLDRSTYGWDVYYRLKPDSTDDEIIAELDTVCKALIDCGKAEKNAFFYNSAQNIAKAILFYTYKTGYSFIDGIDYLTNDSLNAVVTKTLEKVADKLEFQSVKTLLSPYADKEGEAMEGIELSLRESLPIFRTQAAHFFLGTNPRKASPMDLEKKGMTLFFSLPERSLDEYRCIYRLITSQIMSHCSARKEDSHMIALVIDEAARLGIDWTDFMACSRSRQISVCLAMQSWSQAVDKLGMEKSKTLLELCRIVEILSCTDPEMARMLSDWAGTYKERRISTSVGGHGDGSYSESYEDKKIIEISDIMSLQERKEALLFIKGKYYRVNVDKARYYNIPRLNKISKECIAYNDIHQKGGHEHGRRTVNHERQRIC